MRPFYARLMCLLVVLGPSACSPTQNLAPTHVVHAAQPSADVQKASPEKPPESPPTLGKCEHGKAAECELACKAKPHGDDCVTLAGMLLDGVGLPKDPEKSREILEEACHAKFADGCRVLGLMYTEGLGTPYNEGSFMLGARYYTKACELGSMQACAHLGELYSAGKGVKKDAEKSKEHFKKACDGGWDPACTELEPKTKAKP